MSDAKWYVNDFCAKMLRILPRGRTGSVLVGLELDCRAPLDPAAESRVLAGVAETLRPALAASVDVQRFVLLRRKHAVLQKQVRDDELHKTQLEAEKQRLVLAGIADGQAQRLQEIETLLRSVTHSHAQAGGMARAVAVEVEKAKAAAERALHTLLGKERPQALQRAQDARDEALRELCEIAGPALEKLAAALQELRSAASSSERQKQHFARQLDRLVLPADAPEDAPPLPEEPPAPPATQAMIDAVHAAVGPTLPVAGSLTLQR